MNRLKYCLICSRGYVYQEFVSFGTKWSSFTLKITSSRQKMSINSKHGQSNRICYKIGKSQ